MLKRVGTPVISGYTSSANLFFTTPLSLTVCSSGFECSRFVVFAILGLGCTDCSTVLFFLATENFFNENSHVAFFFGWARNVNKFPSSATTRPALARPHLISAKLSGRVQGQTEIPFLKVIFDTPHLATFPSTKPHLRGLEDRESENTRCSGFC